MLDDPGSIPSESKTVFHRQPICKRLQCQTSCDTYSFTITTAANGSLTRSSCIISRHRHHGAAQQQRVAVEVPVLVVTGNESTRGSSRKSTSATPQQHHAMVTKAAMTVAADSVRCCLWSRLRETSGCLDLSLQRQRFFYHPQQISSFECWF